MRLLLLGGIAGPLVFALVATAAATLRLNYRHVANTISELGADGTPYAGLMNYAGFVPAGIMLAAFGVALTWTLRSDRRTIAVSVLATMFGVLLAAAGLISCDPGCPQSRGSLEQVVHDAIGPLMTLCIFAAAGLFGFHPSSRSRWPLLAFYSLLTSALALFLLVMLVRSLEARTFTGLWQRLLLTVLFSWCAVTALTMRRSITTHAAER